MSKLKVGLVTILVIGTMYFLINNYNYSIRNENSHLEKKISETLNISNQNNRIRILNKTEIQGTRTSVILFEKVDTNDLGHAQIEKSLISNKVKIKYIGGSPDQDSATYRIMKTNKGYVGVLIVGKLDNKIKKFKVKAFDGTFEFIYPTEKYSIEYSFIGEDEPKTQGELFFLDDEGNEYKYE